MMKGMMLRRNFLCTFKYINTHPSPPQKQSDKTSSNYRYKAEVENLYSKGFAKSDPIYNSWLKIHSI